MIECGYTCLHRQIFIYMIYIYVYTEYICTERKRARWRERERERDRDRGIDIERERPTGRNFLSSLCFLCSLAGLAALPARLLCWLRLAVLACLLAAGLPDGLHQHTHIDTSFLYNTCSDTSFFYTRFSIHLCLYALVLYNTPRIPDFLYTFLYTPFFYTTLPSSIHIFLYNTPSFYTTRLFSIQLDPGHFLMANCCFTWCFYTCRCTALNAFFLYRLFQTRFFSIQLFPFFYTDCFRHAFFLYNLF